MERRLDGYRWMDEGRSIRRTNRYLVEYATAYIVMFYVLFPCGCLRWGRKSGRQADVLTYRSSFLDKGLKGFYEFVSLR